MSWQLFGQHHYETDVFFYMIPVKEMFIILFRSNIMIFFTMYYVSSPFVYIVFNERNLCFYPVTSSMPTAALALPFTVIH